MRITKIEIESERGRATLTPGVWNGSVAAALTRWHAREDVERIDDEDLDRLAKRLHVEIEGFRGTNGDLAAYRTILDQLA